MFQMTAIIATYTHGNKKAVAGVHPPLEATTVTEFEWRLKVNNPSSRLKKYFCCSFPIPYSNRALFALHNYFITNLRLVHFGTW